MIEPTELYRKHRPTSLKGVIGQDEALKVLKDLSRRESIPHAILLVGPSGVGKTTIARILKKRLDCSDNDFHEINAANTRGIDTVREIISRMNLSPLGGKTRMYLIDEVHKTTGDAQTALLKVLEDPPSHCYFVLATTDPQKLIPTVKTRCTEIRLKAIAPDKLKLIIQEVAGKEQVSVSDEVIERIIECAEGSARKALVLLDSIIGLESEEEQLKVILSSESKQEAIQIARLLMNPRAQWKELASVLKEIKEEPETIRYLVLAYATSVLLGGGKLANRAAQIINRFEMNWYDGKKASMILACYEVMNTK